MSERINVKASGVVTKRIFGQSKAMIRSKYRRGLFIGLLMFSAIIITSHVHAQCDLRVDSKVEQQSGTSNSNILLKVDRGTGSIDFYLIDLKNPHEGPAMKVTRPASELKDDFVIVFNNVKPSTYSIQAVQSKDCQVSVGGVGGITVSTN